MTTSEYRAEHTQSHVPNVRCNIKLPGQSIDVEHLLQRFPTVLRGIVQGVFRQQAGGAWFPCRDLKLAITVLMPQSSEPHHWFGAVACREGSWPMELPNPRPLLRPVTLRTFSRLRHLSMSPHLWGTLNPDWRSGLWWLYLETPIVESAQSIERGCGDCTVGHWVRWCLIPIASAHRLLGLQEYKGSLDVIAGISSRNLAVCSLVVFHFRRLLRQEGAFFH